MLTNMLLILRARICSSMVHWLWIFTPKYRVGCKDSPSDYDERSHRTLPDNARLAVGSFVEEYTNRIQVLGTELDGYGYVYC